MDNRKQFSVEVDTIFNTILAIGGNPSLHSAIDEIVSKDESEYYLYYQKSRYYQDKDVLFKFFPLKFHDYFIKTVGIMERAIDKKDTIHITQLLRKGYPSIFNYMTTNKKITTEKIKNLMLKIKDVKDFTDFEIFSFYSVVLYFASTRRVEIRDEFNIIGYITRYNDSMIESLAYQYQEVGELSAEEKAFMDKYVFGVHKKETINPSTLLDLYIDTEVAQKHFHKKDYDDFLNNYLMTNEITQEEYLEARGDSFRQGGLNSLIGLYSSVLRSVGFHESFSEQEIPSEKMLKAFKSFYEVSKMNNITDSDTIYGGLVSVIFMMSIYNQYEEVLNAYQELYKLNNPFEQQKHQQHLHERLKALKDELVDFKLKTTQKIEFERTNHEKALSNALNEIELLKKENQRLSKELDDKSKHDDELIALRNYVFSQEQTNEFEELSPSTVQDMINSIKDLNIAVVGGHINWLNKMKEIFPSFRYIDINKQRDLSFLNNPNLDCIVYNTATNNHGVYEHITETQNIDFKKFMYLNGNYNLDISIKAIYDFINK